MILVAEGVPADGWVDTARGAHMLGVSREYLRRLVRDGKVRARRVRSRLLVNAASLAAYRPGPAHRPRGSRESRPQVEGFVPVSRAALLLGVTRARVSQLVSAGRLSAVRAGRNVLVSIESVEAYPRCTSGRPRGAGDRRPRRRLADKTNSKEKRPS